MPIPMTEAEARAALQDMKTTDFIADQARAVLAPIEAGERARAALEADVGGMIDAMADGALAEDETLPPAEDETLPPAKAKKRK